MKLNFNSVSRLGSLSLLFALFLLCACTTKNQSQYYTINTDEFSKLIMQDSVQLIDVRTIKEFDEMHIPNSSLIDIKNDKFDSIAEIQLNKDLPVAVYCRSGKRSAEAAEHLVKLGFKVYNLDGGITQWVNDLCPIDSIGYNK